MHVNHGTSVGIKAESCKSAFAIVYQILLEGLSLKRLQVIGTNAPGGVWRGWRHTQYAVALQVSSAC